MLLDAFSNYLNISIEFYLKMVSAVFIVPSSQMDTEMGEVLSYYPQEIVSLDYSGLFTLTILTLTACAVYLVNRGIKQAKNRKVRGNHV